MSVWLLFVLEYNTTRLGWMAAVVLPTSPTENQSQASLKPTQRARIVEYITKDCPSRAKVVITVAPGTGYSAATGSGYQVGVLAVEAE